MKLIAKNGNFYTMSELQDDFWADWKANKDELKAQGYSPFKKNGKWYLSKFTNEKATAEQIKEFNRDQLEKFIGYLNLEPTTDEQIEFFEKVQSSLTVNDAVELIKTTDLFEDAESLVTEALDNLFEANLSE